MASGDGLSLIQVSHWIRKTTTLWSAHPTFSEWSALRSWFLHHIKRNIPSSPEPSPVLLESPKMPSPLPSTQSSHALKKITTPLPDCFVWQLRLALTPPPAPVSNGGALWGSALLLFTLYTHDTERTHEILKYDERRRHERVDYKGRGFGSGANQQSRHWKFDWLNKKGSISAVEWFQTHASKRTESQVREIILSHLNNLSSQMEHFVNPLDLYHVAIW